MKLADFLSTLQKDEKEVIYLCAKHMLKKRYDIQEEALEEHQIKEFFIDYNNYDKYLNDYANIIYKRYESSNDEIYEYLCTYFNENSDNRHLFEYRLKRVINQNPKKYLAIEDFEMRNAAISRLEKRVQIIEESDFFKKNSSLGKKEIDEIKNQINLVKKAVGVI
jgi:hypothetical protein